VTPAPTRLTPRLRSDPGGTPVTGRWYGRRDGLGPGAAPRHWPPSAAGWICNSWC